MATRPSLLAERLAVFTLGLYLTGAGAAALMAGRMAYINYLHIRMPTVSSIVAGAALIALGTVGWKRLSAYL